MTYKFTEESFENAIIELFQQDLAYQFQPGAQIDRQADYRQVLLLPHLQTALQKLNPTAQNIPHLLSKTWTTDAFFRETKEKVDLRKSEDALVVEMEAATLFAVAQFRNINLGQILYAGDDVSGDDWDDRSWDSQEDLRMNLLNLALEICSEF